jgi:hypothetical protein
MLSLALAFSACGGDDNGNTSGTGAGVMAGTGAGIMATGGTGGTTAGTGVTGGTAAGTGVTGGTAAGTGVTGGTAAGTGMTGGTGAGTGMTGGTGAPMFVPGSPTWGAVYNEIIRAKCGGPFCHSGTISTLQMSDSDATYDALVSVPAMAAMNTSATALVTCSTTGMMRVAPGDPDNSIFLLKLEATAEDQPCGQPMPPPPNMLEADQIAQIRMWIANGALKD